MKWAWLSVLLYIAYACAISAQTNVPRTFLFSAPVLVMSRERLRANDPELQPALARLRFEADRALDARYYSVTYKAAIPPSGSRHDYLSQAPYFWADPASSNGMPYIRKDGERNPEVELIPDKSNFNRLADNVETLALGYFFTGEEKYARKGARLLRVWFLDPATRMNPNLNFAQFVPGQSTGRSFGLIESRTLLPILDAVGLLSASTNWSAQDDQKFTQWCGQFLQWMRESEHGRTEAAARNNHGTYYDLQVAALALFTSQTNTAVEALRNAATVRIATQIEPDGSQPLELARTKSWSYSIMNLRGLLLLSRLGPSAAIDLWSVQTPDGRSIRKALSFLLPYLDEGRQWPHPELGRFPRELLHPVLRLAAQVEGEFAPLAASLPPLDPADRYHLTHFPR